MIHTDTLGKMGYLVIKMIKTLAIPLIFFAIVDAIHRTSIGAKHFLRLILICSLNVCVAMGIGLVIMNVFKPGAYWASQHTSLLKTLTNGIGVENPPEKLTFLNVLSGFVPDSVLSPFLTNAVMAVVVLALLFGFALRHHLRETPESPIYIQMRDLIEGGYHLSMTCLSWVIQLVPYAVFGMVTQVIGKSGLEVFKILWLFLCVMTIGLLLHSFGYYTCINWLIGKKTPSLFWRSAQPAILTGFSTNSSLATVPITLESLRKMGVSDESSRMAACIGTNFNNDGIALYEAMAAIFLLQAFGASPDLFGQLGIVGVAIMAGCGIAGIPEAGLVMLPIVLESAGFPTGLVALAIPLIVPVDWIVARCRSVVNVMSDMTVAILLDKR